MSKKLPSLFSDSIGKTKESLLGSLTFSEYTKYANSETIQRVKPYLLFLGSLSLIHLDKLIDKLVNVRTIMVVEDSPKSLMLYLIAFLFAVLKNFSIKRIFQSHS